MSKSFVIVPTVAILILSLAAPAALAQSRQDGIKLFNEAKTLQDNARSNDDLKKAVEKYEQALKIFEKVGDKKGIGLTANNMGLIFKDWGQHPRAVELYEKSLALSRKIGDVRGEGRILNNLGNVYHRWGQYPKAVGFYEKALELSRKTGDVRGEGQTLNDLGEVYREQAQYAKAVEHFEKSLELRRKTGNVRGEGQTLNNLGLVFTAWGRYPKAVEHFDKSLALSRKIGNIRGEGATLNNMAEVYHVWGQHAKAVEYCQKVLELSRKLGNVRSEGRALNNLAMLHKASGQHAKAVELYERSLELKRKVGDLPGEEATLNNMGIVFADWGQYARAVKYYEKSLELKRKTGHVRGEAATLNNLGLVFTAWGQYPKAVEYYEKSLALRRKVRDVRGEAATLNNLGLVYQTWGEYDRAVASFQNALEIYAKIGLAIQTPKANLGHVYLDKGDIQKAEPLAKESGYWGLAGRWRLLKADYSKAKEFYDRLRQSAEKTRSADNLFVAYTGLGLACEGLGDNTAAAEQFRKAIDHIEGLRAGLREAERAEFYNVRIGGFYRTAPYEGLARVLVRMNQSAEALKNSEYTKARVFAEGLSRRSEGSGLDVRKQIIAKDSELNERLAALTKSLYKGYEKGNRDTISALEPQVKDAKQKLDAHIEMLRKDYPLFAATKYPQPMELEHTALKAGEWVLSYDVTDPGVLIYLTRGKELVKCLFKPIQRTEIDKLIRKFRESLEPAAGESIQHKLLAFDFASGKKLSDILLSDVLSQLPKDSPVIIIPDDSLGVVPFEMLVLNDGGKVAKDKQLPYVSGAEFFGDRNPISYYQSITALTLERTLTKQRKPGDRTLAVVDPVFATDDARLAKATREQRRSALDRLTGEKLMSFRSMLKLELPRLPMTGQLGESLKRADPAKTDLYEGLKAQKAVLLKNDLKPYRSCVFATHGYFGKDLPGIKEPVLILTLPNQPQGQDGFLRMTEVMGLKLNADIVALTACRSGLGRQISGEGTMGMGRAFQYAGARCALMSLWSVAESSSVKLVESFFKRLKEGKNKLEALRLARTEIRQHGFDHPFFWAPFVLVGEVE